MILADLKGYVIYKRLLLEDFIKFWTQLIFDNSLKDCLLYLKNKFAVKHASLMEITRAED